MSLLTAQPGSSHDHPQAWKPREERDPPAPSHLRRDTMAAALHPAQPGMSTSHTRATNLTENTSCAWSRGQFLHPQSHRCPHAVPAVPPAPCLRQTAGKWGWRGRCRADGAANRTGSTSP